MDLMMIICRCNGEWNGNDYVGGASFAGVINKNATFVQFVDYIYGLTGIDRTRFDINIHYLIQHLPNIPVVKTTIKDDSGVRFLALQSSEYKFIYVDTIVRDSIVPPYALQQTTGNILSPYASQQTACNIFPQYAPQQSGMIPPYVPQPTIGGIVPSYIPQQTTGLVPQPIADLAVERTNDCENPLCNDNDDVNEGLGINNDDDSDDGDDDDDGDDSGDDSGDDEIVEDNTGTAENSDDRDSVTSRLPRSCHLAHPAPKIVTLAHRGERPTRKPSTVPSPRGFSFRLRHLSNPRPGVK